MLCSHARSPRRVRLQWSQVAGPAWQVPRCPSGEDAPRRARAEFGRGAAALQPTRPRPEPETRSFRSPNRADEPRARTRPPDPVVIAPPAGSACLSNDARGHCITGLRSWSPLRGELRPGARIVSVSGEDTRGAPNERIVAVLARRQGVRAAPRRARRGLTVAQTLECAASGAMAAESPSARASPSRTRCAARPAAPAARARRRRRACVGAQARVGDGAGRCATLARPRSTTRPRRPAAPAAPAATTRCARRRGARAARGAAPAQRAHARDPRGQIAARAA